MLCSYILDMIQFHTIYCELVPIQKLELQKSQSLSSKFLNVGKVHPPDHL